MSGKFKILGIGGVGIATIIVILLTLGIVYLLIQGDSTFLSIAHEHRSEIRCNHTLSVDENGCPQSTWEHRGSYAYACLYNYLWCSRETELGWCIYESKDMLNLDPNEITGQPEDFNPENLGWYCTATGKEYSDTTPTTIPTTTTTVQPTTTTTIENLIEPPTKGIVDQLNNFINGILNWISNLW